MSPQQRKWNDDLEHQAHAKDQFGVSLFSSQPGSAPNKVIKALYFKVRELEERLEKFERRNANHD